MEWDSIMEQKNQNRKCGMGSKLWNGREWTRYIPIDALTVLAFPSDREIKLGLHVERTSIGYMHLHCLHTICILCHTLHTLFAYYLHTMSHPVCILFTHYSHTVCILFTHYSRTALTCSCTPIAIA